MGYEPATEMNWIEKGYLMLFKIYNDWWDMKIINKKVKPMNV